MSGNTLMNISPVRGTGADDHLTGTGRSEILAGAQGNDKIFGLSGNDELHGGTGDDVLYGQAGNDTIYGNGKPAFIDLSNFVVRETVEAKVTFQSEGAGYRNSLGVYEINSDGTFSNVKILFPNASAQGSGGNLIGGVSQESFTANAGQQLGFFILPNGYGKGFENRAALDAQSGHHELRTLSGEPGNTGGGPVELWYVNDVSGEEYRVISQFGSSTFHSTAAVEDSYDLNPDNYEHVVGRANAVSGEILIGFEDIYNGGDKDFDDLVITIDVGQANVVAQLPQSTGTEPVQDDDILYGGDGDDTLYGISGDDILEGGQGHDKLHGNSGSDSLYGSSGNDLLFGNSGNDFLSGGWGSDQLEGGSGNDRLEGDSGNDTLSGGSGFDFLYGGSGNDIVHGNSGDDKLYGENGDDMLNGNSGDDRLFGGNGADELNGHSGSDTIYGDSGSDKLIGGGGDDLLFGGDHNDKVYGGSGIDQLSGGSGNDYLSAGSGHDIIDGGAGSDKLFGGKGSDKFVFNSYQTGDRDIIGDFSSDDVVDISGFGFVSFDDVLANASQQGSHTVIDFFDDYSLRMNNFDVETLESDDFIL